MEEVLASPGGVTHVTYFRSAFNTALDALRDARVVQLRRDDGEVGDRRQAPMDSEVFRAHQDAIDATTVKKAFVLGLYVHSDASLMSWSGAHYRYPIRIRVVNDVPGEVRWFTIAYVPIVRTLKEPGAKQQATGRRWGVLQRTLYLAFREAIAESHGGHQLDECIGAYSLAFLRVLLYACDTPEEWAVLCIKAGDFGKSCSTCERQDEDACSEKGVTAAPRDVVETLTRYLEAVMLGRTTRTRKRRVILETKSSINAFVPALASLGGLDTVPHHLYKMIAIDPLHVLDLGISRMMCHRLIFLFSHVCKEFFPEYKDESATARAGNVRTEFLGRRSLAPFISPGCLVGLKEKQATFNGEQQRAGVWILMFLVAGLFRPGTRRRLPPKNKAKQDSAPDKRKEESTPRPTWSSTALPSTPSTDGPTSPSTCPTPLSGAEAPAAVELPAKDPADEADNILASLLGMDDSDMDGRVGGSDSEARTDVDDGSEVETDVELDPSTKADGSCGAEDDEPAGTTSTSDDIKCVTKNLRFVWNAYHARFGSTAYDKAATQMFVRYARLVDRLTGVYHCRKPMSVAEAEEVVSFARSFVLDFLTPILGKFFSTKVHKLLAHVLAAIKMHGAIKKGRHRGQ
eukprot:TRINITY_DN1859_c0_g1_i2.p1 TRINITY_DN1859_c0_g1~~TRINITY_DN1859_c0_g1_i2.p1  ORF type:complete len:629 (-),score=101.22 TRINITY_DN1859_c0_g1_i2:903-2789(-)